MSYNTFVLASCNNRQLLLICGDDNSPMLSVYDDHNDQTLIRHLASNVDNLKYALSVLENGEL